MPISDRDQAIFEGLTRQFRAHHRRRGWFADGQQRTAVPLTIIVAGMAALPVGIATDHLWIGLVGFLVAVPTTAQLLATVPFPSRGRFRAQILLRTTTIVDRRDHDGTMAARDSAILPRRLLGFVVGLLVIAAAVIQPATGPPSVIDSHMEQLQLRPEASANGPVEVGSRRQPAGRTSRAILDCPPVTRSCGARMVWQLLLAP